MNYLIGFNPYKLVNFLILCMLWVSVTACSSDSPQYAPVADISDLGVFIQRKSIDSVSVKPHLATQWIWPAQGQVASGFTGSNKGIDIAGVLGESVYASAAGTVVYSGRGLRGYGDLVIIKHNDIYLSAYAYNELSFVRTGQHVRQGQKIAKMGMSRSKIPLLHFEIRHRGKAIDPLTLLLPNTVSR